MIPNKINEIANIQSLSQYITKLECKYNMYIECLEPNIILNFLIEEGLIIKELSTNNNSSKLRKIMSLIEKRFINSFYITKKIARSKLFDIEVGIANYLYGINYTNKSIEKTNNKTVMPMNICETLPILNSKNNPENDNNSFDEFLRSISAITVESEPYMSPQLQPKVNPLYNVPYLLLNSQGINPK
jgi:hypothetical protein